MHVPRDERALAGPTGIGAEMGSGGLTLYHSWGSFPWASHHADPAQAGPVTSFRCMGF